MLKAVSEVIDEVRKLDSRHAKIEHLRRNQSLPMLRIFAYAYDPRIKWLLPDGDPPYVPLGTKDRNELIGAEAMLHKEARTLYLFVYGDEYNPLGVYEVPGVDEATLTEADKTKRRQMASRRELKFVELLEQVLPGDAELLVAAKNGSIPGVERSLVTEAFPGLLQETVAMAAERVVARVAEAIKPTPPPVPKITKKEVMARREARRSAILDFLSHRDGASSAEIHEHLLGLGLADAKSRSAMDFAMKSLADKNAAIKRDDSTGAWRYVR